MILLLLLISDILPQVSLNFAGSASMILRPQDYLLQQNSVGGSAVWCIGIQKIQGQGITILGDLVLKDKIVVYDLATGDENLPRKTGRCDEFRHFATKRNRHNPDRKKTQQDPSQSLRRNNYFRRKPCDDTRESSQELIFFTKLIFIVLRRKYVLRRKP